ncbi:hypothetical protein CQW23_07278 [Capsicum baccatum]|uniref:Uncharacterized protein n=1 Tax=Capsicum baccatum TaxID=33114 RepID=A0A2G2X5R7_CAPBA|nr:hypothetical protein CQW23_07278 [Capsicum baccatum]
MEKLTSTVSEAYNEELKKVPSLEKIKDAVMNLNENSARGPNGMTGSFYQDAWDIFAQYCLPFIAILLRGPVLMSHSSRSFNPEILCAESVDEQDEVDNAAPEGFPFKIEHHPGQQTITLTREYQGESIVVEVHMPDLISGSEDENDGNAEDDRESGNQSQIPLIIRVSRKNGLSLEFSLTTYADEILIESLSIKDPKVAEDQIAYEGPDFSWVLKFD